MRVWKKKLQNPFLLVGQGFVLGGILFFALNAPGEAAFVAPITVDSSR